MFFEISRFCGINFLVILSKSKKCKMKALSRRVANIRIFSFYLAKKYTDLSLPALNPMHPFRHIAKIPGRLAASRVVVSALTINLCCF